MRPLTSRSLCSKCVSGVVHEGTPKLGEEKTIGGIKCWTATPATEYPKDKALLFITDVRPHVGRITDAAQIFGLPLNNNKLLISSFAENGFRVVAPDMFDGEAVDPEEMGKGNVDLKAVIGKHLPNAMPIVHKVMDELKAEGVKSFYAVGYCYGGKMTFELAAAKEIVAGAVCHPSLLQHPQDVDALAKSGVPMLIEHPEEDGQFPPDARKHADEVLTDTKLYRQDVFKGVGHGYAVRGDLSKPEIKEAKEQTFKNCVEFLASY